MSASRTVGFCVFLSISLAQAQVKDVAAPNADAILKEITALEQRQKQGKMTARNAIIGQIQAVAANGSAALANFYTQAVEAVQFKGMQDEGAAFLAWKKANADLLRSKEMQTALQLHFKYLLLSFQRKDLEKPETQLPDLMAYVSEVVSDDDLFLKQNPKQNSKQNPKQKSFNDEAMAILNKPINGSVFAQWLSFGEWLPNGQSWELQPANIPGILEQNIRSVMREKKDPQLIGTWDMEMKVDAARITSGRSEYKADQFNTVDRPRLQFKQAQDMILIGQPNRGLTAMIALVRTNMWHPDFGIWVANIRELIKPASAQTSPPAAPDTAP